MVFLLKSVFLYRKKDYTYKKQGKRTGKIYDINYGV